MEWVSMLGCLGNVRPYMLETILFLIFRLSDFKDMSNLKIESIHLRLSRSVSIDRLKKARTYRTQREIIILNNKKTREEIISISTTIDDFKKVSKNRNKPDSKKEIPLRKKRYKNNEEKKEKNCQRQKKN